MGGGLVRVDLGALSDAVRHENPQRWSIGRSHDSRAYPVGSPVLRPRDD